MLSLTNGTWADGVHRYVLPTLRRTSTATSTVGAWSSTAWISTGRADCTPSWSTITSSNSTDCVMRSSPAKATRKVSFSTATGTGAVDPGAAPGTRPDRGWRKTFASGLSAVPVRTSSVPAGTEQTDLSPVSDRSFSARTCRSPFSSSNRGGSGVPSARSLAAPGGRGTPAATRRGRAG